MPLIYGTEQLSGKFPINIHNLDPIKQWSKHYENYKYLEFIHNNTNDWQEKRQANFEMQIATKKMDFWYNKATSLAISESKKIIDRKWSIKP